MDSKRSLRARAFLALAASACAALAVYSFAAPWDIPH